MRTRHIIVGLISATCLVNAAHAAQIPGLWNTGVDSLGAELSDGSAEIHYQLNGNAPVVYQHPAWFNASDAHWISALANGSYDTAANTYTLTFDLTGLDPTTAVLQGLFAADDAASVYLNGNFGASVSGYSQLQAFSFNSGFLAGINTLSFQVQDIFGQPSGFIVSGLTGTADEAQSAVPEPASWALMVGGFGLVGGALRSRRKAKVSFA